MKPAKQPSIFDLENTVTENALTTYIPAEKEQPRIKAINDQEALNCWLNEYKTSPATFRTYQKEAERFLLWLVIQQKKGFRTLARTDIDAYQQFMSNPQPQEIWCGKNGRGKKRGDEHWRPFVGPLSVTARQVALSAIDSMLRYLVDAAYIPFNPFILMRKKNFTETPATNTTFAIQARILNIDEWHAMLDTLDEYPENSQEEKNEKERLYFLIAILYCLGLRINELVTHGWESFQKIEDRWWFYVVGKGNKLARIPVNDELLRAIIRYRAHLNKRPFPESGESGPLIVSLISKRAITARYINKILKNLAEETAKKFTNQPERAKKLKKFSAHWLRHLSASMQDHAGIAFKHIRANHRHENDETTRHYVHAFDNERHAEMDKLKLRVNHSKF